MSFLRSLSPSFSLATGARFASISVPRLVCVCELANVRDLQDRAPFVRQSYFDLLPCEVLMSWLSADVASKADVQFEVVGLG